MDIFAAIQSLIIYIGVHRFTSIYITTIFKFLNILLFEKCNSYYIPFLDRLCKVRQKLICLMWTNCRVIFLHFHTNQNFVFGQRISQWFKQMIIWRGQIWRISRMHQHFFIECVIFRYYSINQPQNSIYLM